MVSGHAARQLLGAASHTAPTRPGRRSLTATLCKAQKAAGMKVNIACSRSYIRHEYHTVITDVTQKDLIGRPPVNTHYSGKIMELNIY
ncbi:hypothetical protein E2C01_101042 [Portunus trituberculatus]|uniref:Uncharacterized protein n=1 Tax=Portunus trituberculatus TaxID=210409 RepID=A0A5B7KF42_PORTR|nr:hypothetical protein [Portunus trituberculatus]